MVRAQSMTPRWLTSPRKVVKSINEFMGLKTTESHDGRHQDKLPRFISVSECLVPHPSPFSLRKQENENRPWRVMELSLNIARPYSKFLNLSVHENYLERLLKDNS